ncbi:TIGR03086 family metal-binding protein [Nocardioides sp. LHD-245]|uniref:TIGR03086 family metal-binding protein n=1 Tax=Nocardioides sp. LHD-245 TaxID=3051387 RepID=UPI0027E0CB3D|nr:TIGR03086 family metal-binding protein [Nocardioides sp. LHD-245]
MTTLDFGPATTTLRDLVTSVGDDQLTLPTPCSAYSVGDLVDHVGGLALAFAGAARKEQVPGSEQGGSGDATRLEPGWRARIDGSLADLAEAWRAPAAYDGDTMAGPVEMSGAEAAAVALNEVVVHGWDLASALGVPYAVREEDVAACLAFVRPFSTPEAAAFRGDAFGEVLPVPVGAPALVELLALLGRRG